MERSVQTEFTTKRSLLSIESEQTLETHDLALPLPLKRSQTQQEWFRLLLLSPSDTQSESNHMARIERLYHQSGGLNVGIVFLLRDSSSQEEGTKHFMALQLRYLPCGPTTPRIIIMKIQSSRCIRYANHPPLLGLSAPANSLLVPTTARPVAPSSQANGRSQHGITTILFCRWTDP